MGLPLFHRSRSERILVRRVKWKMLSPCKKLPHCFDGLRSFELLCVFRTWLVRSVYTAWSFFAIQEFFYPSHFHYHLCLFTIIINFNNLDPLRTSPGGKRRCLLDGERERGRAGTDNSPLFAGTKFEGPYYGSLHSHVPRNLQDHPRVSFVFVWNDFTISNA